MTGALPSLAGTAASGGWARGSAWSVPGGLDGGSVPPGAILVARMLSPHHAPLLARAAGVVVEEGGLLQHATTLARELGIPAVVGVVGAVEAFPPGAPVEVDGDAGVVRPWSPPEPLDEATARLVAAERRLFERYGLDVSSETIDIPHLNLRTRVLRAGQGPPVLFLHGGSGTSALWAPLIANMPGFTAFAVDRPGAGTGLALDYAGLDLREHATTFLESVLDTLGLTRVPVVANSLGGLWSFWLAAHLTGGVSALVQMGCPALLFGTKAPLAMRFLSLGPISPGDRRDRAAEMLRHVAGDGDLPGLPAEFVDCLYAAEIRPAHVRTRASLLRAAGELQRRDPEMGMGPAELARIACPVLFVWGTADWYGPPEIGRRACGLLGRGSLEVVEAGHLPWLQEPERCAELAGRVIVAAASDREAHPPSGDEPHRHQSTPQ